MAVAPEGRKKCAYPRIESFQETLLAPLPGRNRFGTPLIRWFRCAPPPATLFRPSGASACGELPGFVGRTAAVAFLQCVPTTGFGSVIRLRQIHFFPCHSGQPTKRWLMASRLAT